MGELPPMLPPVADEDASPEVAAVYADIRATRGTDFINAFWRVLAHDPALLARTWHDVKAVMAPGALDPLTKELVYVAVSITNGCNYCINSHVAGARAKGMTDAQLMELIGVVGMANETNRLVTGLQVPVDEAFLAPRRAPAPSDGDAAAAAKTPAEATGPEEPVPAKKPARAKAARKEAQAAPAAAKASTAAVSTASPSAARASTARPSATKASGARGAAAKGAGAKGAGAKGAGANGKAERPASAAASRATAKDENGDGASAKASPRTGRTGRRKAKGEA